MADLNEKSIQNFINKFKNIDKVSDGLTESVSTAVKASKKANFFIKRTLNKFGDDPAVQKSISNYQKALEDQVKLVSNKEQVIALDKTIANYNAQIRKQQAIADSEVSTKKEKNEALKKIIDVESKLQSRKENISRQFFQEEQAINQNVLKSEEEYNKQVVRLENNLRKTADGTTFNGFTDGIKELTGGIVDIGKILDIGKKKWEAVKGIFGPIASAGKGLFDGAKKLSDWSISKLGWEQETLDDEKELNEEEKKERLGFLGATKKLTLQLLKSIAAIGITVFGPILLLGAAIAGIIYLINNYKDDLGQAVEDFPAAISRGISEGVTRIATMIDDMISGIGKAWGKLTGTLDDMGKGLTNLIRKLPGLEDFGKSADDIAREAAERAGQRAAGEVVEEGAERAGQRAAGEVVEEGAERAVLRGVASEVAEEGVQQTSRFGRFFQGAKNLAKGVIRKIPAIGSIVEGGLDANDQHAAMAQIRQAYEAGVITEEEYNEAEAAYTANMAGSVGRGAGSFAGGAAGATLGATIGSVVPFVGTIIGGVVGGIAGSLLGGWGGDEIATDAAEAFTGSENSQQMIDDLVARIQSDPRMSSEEIADARGEIEQVVNVTNNSQQVVSVDNSSSASYNAMGVPQTRNNDSTARLAEASV